MPLENLMREYNALKKEIFTALEKQDELIKKMANLDADSYDWISVNEAAKRCGVCYVTIKRKADSGQLDVKRIASKTFVRWSEVQRINDK